MNSAERLTAALKGEDVDYTPCAPAFWSGHPQAHSFGFKNEEDRLTFHLEKLGVDAVLNFGVSHRQASMRSWVEDVPGSDYPLLHSEMETPKGKLEAIIRKTEDYAGGSIPLFSDWTVSRYVKPWIENMEDVEKLATVYLPPTDAQISAAGESLKERKKVAQKWGLPIVGGGFFAMNAMIHLMGAQQSMLVSMDNPEVIEALNDVIYSVNRKKLEAMVSLGVKIVLRNGWYDTTEFWSPTQYKRWVVPNLKADIELVHSAGGIFIYQACTGIKPLLSILSELEFDCLLEPEPVLGAMDMADLKAALPGKSFWGGVSAPIHIGEGTPEIARLAVRDAFRAFGNKGFILKAVPSIRAHWPWENVLAMLNEWKRLR